MEIQITQKQCGGTEFLARPHRLHLGAQNAAGVDQLHFILPEAWAGCSAALYLRRADGTLLAPVSLDGEGRVTVDRRLTGSTGGQWMLAAIRGEDYTAYTRPGSYDTYAILPTDGSTEELPPSLYEQFVARVLESASTASTAAQRAAQRAETGRTAALEAADRAETAAARAEALAPEEGRVVSVNGKAGIVRLTAQDVGALPCPAQPVAGQLLRVLSTDPDTGAVRTDTTPPPDLTPYVRSSTVPTAAVPGAVKADPAFGVTVRADGTLATAPADEAALDAMADPYAPLTPALLPYGVKKALTAAAAAAPWSAEEKSAARRTLGVELASYYTKEDVDALLAAPSLAAYPVGSIYQSVLPASPAALFGGTWEQIAQDRVLMGASDSHKAGSTVEAGLPNITGQIAYNSSHGLVSSNSAVSSGCVFPGASIRNGALTGNNTAQTRDLAIDASRSSAVYGRSDTVQPAAYYVYIWLRVA